MFTIINRGLAHMDNHGVISKIRRYDWAHLILRLLMAVPYLVLFAAFFCDAWDFYLECIVNKEGTHAALYGTDPNKVWLYLLKSVSIMCWLLIGIGLVIKQAGRPRPTLLKMHALISLACMLFFVFIRPILVATGLMEEFH